MQVLPFTPVGQSVVLGSLTQLQSAAGAPLHWRLPVHIFAIDEVGQLSLLVPQLITVSVPRQTVPLATPEHSAATGPHIQSADPAGPPQGLPAVQVLVTEEVGQPSAFTPQVMTVLPLHTVPLVRPA